MGDARRSPVYAEEAYDAIVCTEVLEHVEDDLIIVSQFRRGKLCLCTVPNFPYPSHVRCFEGLEAVRARYGAFFDHLEVSTVKSPRNPRNEFYLLDGVRNDRKLAA